MDYPVRSKGSPVRKRRRSVVIIRKTASLKVGDVNPGGETQPRDVMPFPCFRSPKHKENKCVFSATESMAAHRAPV